MQILKFLPQHFSGGQPHFAELGQQGAQPKTNQNKKWRVNYEP